MSRAVDIPDGKVMVVTDLHGEWEPYCRYRDHFLAIRDQGEADRLIFLGDIIHGYGPSEQDFSLNILWDIMQLQARLGPQTVVMLLGNHEMPHIYGVSVSKGEQEFTSRFEHSLGEYRPQVVDFLKSLPLLARTGGGVMLTHAGPSPTIATPHAAEQIDNFSHDALLAEGDRLLAREDVIDLVMSEMNIRPEEYDMQARHFLAVTGPDDPRYYDLLRSQIVSNLKEWQVLWDFLFNQGEAGHSQGFYRQVLERFLDAYSAPGLQQLVLVTGHLAVKGGHAVVAGKQLRLASWAHATPHKAGCFLLFDASQPVNSAADLLAGVHPILNN